MIIAMGRRMVSELRDPDWLRSVYVDEGRSAAQISRELGCSNSTVSDALRRHGIPIRTIREATQLRARRELLSPRAAMHLADERWMTSAYVDRSLSTVQIAELLGCASSTVQKALRELGLDGALEAGYRRRGISPDSIERLGSREWLIEAYMAQRRPSTEIAAELGCSDDTVLTALRRHGVSVRSTGEANRNAAAAARNGYDAQRRRRLASLARDAGEVGRAYTAVIRVLGQLDRVPHVGREESRLEREAMDGLYRAQDALAQRLLLGRDETAA